MIVTRTPFRVTLGGGGTDLPSFYEKHGGFIFAMGIDKYMYVMTNPPGVDRKIRVRYSQTEIVDHISQLRHELAREALNLHGIEDRMEIDSMADLPAGTGLGSSSAYLIGLLSALHSYRRDYISLQALAEEACHIELNVLRKGIGKQDQYMAAFGGLTVLDIAPNGDVKVRNVQLRESAIATLISHTHLYYTGLARDALEILSQQNKAMNSSGAQRERVEDSLLGIKELGYQILEAIEGEDFDKWGLLLHDHWERKKRMSSQISHGAIDQLYDECRSRFGVLGGKIIGAGGGGFLALYCSKDDGDLEDFMMSHGMPRLNYYVEREGSKVVANVASTQSMILHPRTAAAGLEFAER
ncbi:MAG: galactokinase [Gemmatimonadetes bacterium]|nr:galactokinase [Gemmatimonadota bacterium]